MFYVLKKRGVFISNILKHCDAVLYIRLNHWFCDVGIKCTYNCIGLLYTYLLWIKCAFLLYSEFEQCSFIFIRTTFVGWLKTCCLINLFCLSFRTFWFGIRQLCGLSFFDTSPSVKFVICVITIFISFLLAWMMLVLHRLFVARYLSGLFYS